MDQAFSFINCQLRSPTGTVQLTTTPVITISRMTGSGGRTVAAHLSEFLERKAVGQCRWTVFDKNLVEAVLQEHHLSKQIADYMPENHKSMIQDTVEEFLGLHPSSWTLVENTTRTILHLAQMGGVILVGRGANVITSKLPNAFHVRLVGSVEKRSQRVEAVYQLSPNAALEFIAKEDRGRRRYLKAHFGKDIDDPLLYDLIINTDQLSCSDAAALIGDCVIKRFKLAQPE
jgi:cytidylate kinase